jgi:flavin-dependent dehydrogenase
VEAAKALERLLEHLELGSRRNIQGAVVPTFRGSVLPGKGRVLLAGEAAGLCDRVSGEGIAHALESGLLAAEAILSDAGAWSAGARCARQVKDSGFYRHFLYGGPFRKLAMKKLRESDRFQELYWRIIAGDSDYAVLLQRRRPMSFSAT